jgi:hypothetical protein
MNQPAKQYTAKELETARGKSGQKPYFENENVTCYISRIGKGRFFAYLFLNQDINPAIYGYYSDIEEVKTDIELLNMGASRRKEREE